MNDVVVFWFPWIVLAVALAVWAYGLLDFMKTDERDIRMFSRSVWLVVLVFGSVFGATAWMVAEHTHRPGDR